MSRKDESADNLYRYFFEKLEAGLSARLLILPHIVWYNMDMGIVRKKRAGREYIYLSMREGETVVQKYLGTAGSPEAARAVGERAETTAIPEILHPLFWDTAPGKIHLRRNARYIIERVLEYGDLTAVMWLQRVYPCQKIIDTLRLSRVVTNRSAQFWKLWFGMQDA